MADTWDDDDDNWAGDDDGDGEWGDFEENDGLMNLDTPPPTKKRVVDEPMEWKCLECEHMNPGARGLLCLNCNEPNLAELDRQRREFEQQEVTFFKAIYTKTYIPLRLHETSGIDLERSFASTSIQELYDHMGTDAKIPNILNEAPCETDECRVCFTNFNESKENELISLPCHSMSCAECFRRYVQIRIDDEDIIPHIPCPHEECTIPITCDKLLSCGLSVNQLYDYVTTYTRKMLSRNSFWAFCPSNGCNFGFMFEGNENEQTFTCESCYEQHTVRREEEMDEGFQEMVRQGKIRMCPACSHPHMKDKGICNVMQCGKCNIWWNWQTRETGNSMRELKLLARNDRSLWEPGELEFQQTLQTSDPTAFRALLERNGIKYDPNYVRGS